LPEKDDHYNRDDITPEEAARLKRKKIYSVISIVIFVALMIWLAFEIGTPLVQMLRRPQQFRDLIDDNGILARLIFIGLQLLQIFIAFIPGEVVEVAAGYAFGTIEGTLLCMAGSALGSVLVIWFVRSLGVKAIDTLISREKIAELRFIRNEKQLDKLVFLLFFIPGTPKDVLTYFIGFTPIKTSRFVLISTFARIPSIITSTIGGDALGTEKYVFAIIVFVATAIISLLGLLIYNSIMKKKNSEKDENDAKENSKTQQDAEPKKYEKVNLSPSMAMEAGDELGVSHENATRHAQSKKNPRIPIYLLFRKRKGKTKRNLVGF
jgi:uncharacterized membrane protein YdjX (TVP38/TMEM64 family)